MSQNREIGNGKWEIGLSRAHPWVPIISSCLVWSVLLGFLVRSSSEPLLSMHVLSTGAEKDHIYIYFGVCVSICIFILIPRVLAGLKRGPGNYGLL